MTVASSLRVFVDPVTTMANHQSRSIATWEMECWLQLHNNAICLLKLTGTAIVFTNLFSRRCMWFTCGFFIGRYNIESSDPTRVLKKSTWRWINKENCLNVCNHFPDKISPVHRVVFFPADKMSWSQTLVREVEVVWLLQSKQTLFRFVVKKVNS